MYWCADHRYRHDALHMYMSMVSTNNLRQSDENTEVSSRISAYTRPNLYSLYALPFSSLNKYSSLVDDDNLCRFTLEIGQTGLQVGLMQQNEQDWLGIMKNATSMFRFRFLRCSVLNQIEFTPTVHYCTGKCNRILMKRRFQRIS